MGARGRKFDGEEGVKEQDEKLSEGDFACEYQGERRRNKERMLSQDESITFWE